MKLKLKNMLLPEHTAFLGHYHVRPGIKHRPHTHDFSEVFWISSGRGIHEWNGQAHEISVGDCQCIHAPLEHRLWSSDSQPLHIQVLCFRPQVISGMLRAEGQWFTDTPLEPAPRLVPEQLHMLSHWTRQFHDLKGNDLALHSFLHTLKAMILSAPTGGAPIPPWLNELRLEAKQHDHLREGLPALIRMSNKSQAHLCRQWRKAFGRIPHNLHQS